MKYIKSIARLLQLASLGLLPALSGCSTVSRTSVAPYQKILVFSKTAGFHHNSIKAGITAIRQLGAENKFEVDTTTDASKFTPGNLKHYAAIVFLSTTGPSKKLFTEEEKAAFQQYIRQGGGYVGIHAATDACADWAWYGDLSGGYFSGHINGPASLKVVDKRHPSTKMLPESWSRNDEWYSFRYLAPGLKVLIKLDESTATYEPKNARLKMGDHPIAWYHQYDGGRAFYTGLGHTEDTYREPLFLQHVLGGIKYAMGH
jgi:type 1 glutamine amidotransferase